MRYFKIEENGYIRSVGHGTVGVEITEAEYDEINRVITEKPIPVGGYGYRLKTNLTWELYELPPVEVEEDEEATAADYLAALAELGVTDEEE